MGVGRWIFVAVGVTAILILVLLWLAPRIEEHFAPEPRAAWVGIEEEGSGVAVVGRVFLRSSTRFRLHAVLEAETQRGTTRYYTEAQRLRIGGEEVLPESLRRWDESREVRLLWFSVEGKAPYLALKSGEDLDRLNFREFFRPEWGRGWSIPGSLEPRNDDQLEAGSPDLDRAFGTQRYQVWIEIYAPEAPLVAQQRFKSWGAEDLPQKADRFPTVIASLEGPAGPASRVFGLTQVDLPAGADASVVKLASDLASRELLFTRLTVLRDVITAVGQTPDGLAWRRIDLRSGPPWGVTVSSGDLLRVGARIVVLYADRGTAGILDRQDICLDFEQGATLRELREVFADQGDVEWAHLDGRTDGEAL